MSDTSVTGAGRRHFTPEDEEMLRRNESTNDIVKRDTKTTVDLHGLDRSRRQLDEEHKRHVGIGGVEIGAGAMEGLEMSGVVEVAAELAAHHAVKAGIIAACETGFALAPPIAGIFLTANLMNETEEQSDAQGRATSRETVRSAVISALDLPTDYKTKRLDLDLGGVARQHDSLMMKMTAQLNADPKGLAVLQLHCDQGMNAARDLLASHKDVATFLKENPKVAEAYRQDAAFHEGFDAYLSTKDRKGLDQKLNERDGWYAQSHVSFRV